MAVSGVFISYRHSDSQSAAGRLADSLERQFGKEQIFRDVETLRPGVDFVDAIESALSSCAVVLAVIGRRWMGDTPGQNRLQLANDWIRIEIATALRRNIRVIPVLVEEAEPPAEVDLPDDLKSLARRHALSLTDTRWDFDVQQLSAALKEIGIRPLPEPASPQPGPRPAQGTSKIMKTLAWIGGIFVALVVLGLIIGENTPQTPLPQQQFPLPVNTQPAQIASGMPASACGCWGYASAGYTTVNPQCATGYQYVQACMSQCPAGGSSWQTICQ